MLAEQSREAFLPNDGRVVSGSGMIFLGVDLAWSAGTTTKVPADTGVVALDASGRVVDATWTVSVPDTLAWAARHADSDALMFVDAPLVVLNPAGQRLCEKHVGQRYGRWKVSANSTNLGSKSLAGVRLREAAESACSAVLVGRGLSAVFRQSCVGVLPVHDDRRRTGTRIRI